MSQVYIFKNMHSFFIAKTYVIQTKMYLKYIKNVK